MSGICKVNDVSLHTHMSYVNFKARLGLVEGEERITSKREV
jgi:hypothetical protein